MRRSIKDKILLALRVDRAVHLVWQAGPGWCLANFSLQIIQGILPLAALYLMKLIVDAVIFSINTPDTAQAFRHIILLILLAGFVALLNSLCQHLATTASEAMSLTVTDHVFDILHAKSVEVDLEYYENPKYFDTLHRAQQEGPYRPTNIVNDLIRLAQNSVTLLAMAGLLLTLHWGVACVLFLAVVPGVFVRIRYANRLFLFHQERTRVERQALYINWILTGDIHAKEVRLFGLGDLLIQRFSKLHDELRHEKLAIGKKRSKADFMAQAGATIAVFGSFAFIAYKTLHGTITPGDMVMYFQAFQRGLSSMRDLLGSMATLYEDNLFLTNLHDFLSLRPKVTEPANPVPVPNPLQKGIVFEKVSFHYPSSNRKVLEDISFAIAPGETVALVGRNGSGKTTLVKLLCRLYDPDQGSISLDGINLKQFQTVSLRSQTSVLMQDFVKYYLTVRENIWFGNVDQPPDDENIRTAAQKAGVHELIENLPQGYNTQLGKWFEDGEELSSGEWQKIALARTFLRESQIILLDEPASSLDHRAGHEIFCKFKELTQGKTSLFVSHRLATVKMADRIIVLDKGKIVESGAYDELMRKKGSFAYLFDRRTKKRE
jgi:ATP-binding cassette subfamily B protein